MNNTTTTTRTKRNLALAAVFVAVTLVVGTFATVAAVTQQSAFAIPQKKPPGHDDKKDKARDNNGSANGNGNTVTTEECKNRGSASGFDTAVDQECENLICTHPASDATCVSENEGATTTTTPVTTPTGTLIVKKLVECRIGITCSSPSDFTIKVTGNHPTPSTFQVTSESGTVVTLGVGAYKVSEEPFQGFEPSFSADCEGTIAPGDQKTCTITNSQSSAG
jgi:hypothetical protein